MSELKDYSILDIEAIDDERNKTESAPGKWVPESRVYLKSEADKVIAELKNQRDGAFGLANSGLTLEDISQMARKEIDRQKYKRCLLRSVIAEMNATHFKDLFYGAGSGALADAYNEQITIHYKWNKLWLKLAEKFNEAK